MFPESKDEKGNILEANIDQNNGNIVDYGYVYHLNNSDVEVLTHNSYKILTFKTKANLKNIGFTTMVVTANNSYSNKIYSYSYDSIISIIDKYESSKHMLINPYQEQYNAIMNSVVMGTDIDDNLLSCVTYNISSTNCRFSIKDFASYITNVEDEDTSYTRLNAGLFRICIGGEYYITSDMFDTLDNAINVKSSITGLDTTFTGTLNLSSSSWSVDSSGEISVIIKASINIAYDKYGSLPTVSIESGSNKYPIAHDSDGNGSIDKNLTLKKVGSTVDYSYATTKETIYKPFGNEVYGTNVDTSNGSNSTDSSNRSSNVAINGFFSNIYSSSGISSGGHFELPNMNVGVNLIYKQAIKKINSHASFVSDDLSEIIETQLPLLGNNGSNIYNTEISKKNIFSRLYYSMNAVLPHVSESKANPGDISSVGGSGIAIFNDEKMKNAGVDADLTNLDTFTQDGLIFENYYIYVISNAYEVLTLLEEVIRKTLYSVGNFHDLARAYDMYNYISTYNPSLYGERYYLFGSDELHDASYSYIELRDLITKYVPKHNLLDPEIYNIDKYMTVRKIDILSAAISGVDLNFISSFFTQKDLVVSSFELKEMFQNQVMYYGQFPMIANWDADYAYNFYFNAQNNMTGNIETDSFVWSGAPADTFLSSNGTGTTNSSVVKNMDTAKKRNVNMIFANLFRMKGELWSNKKYLAMVDSSISVGPEDFIKTNAGNVNLHSVNNVIRIDDRVDRVSSTNSSNRIKTVIYPFNPEPLSVHVERAAIVVAGVAGAILTFGNPAGATLGILIATEITSVGTLAYSHFVMSGEYNSRVSKYQLELYAQAYNYDEKTDTYEFTGLESDKVTQAYKEQRSSQ